jgi:Transposase IS116/IS110/IS902 family
VYQWIDYSTIHDLFNGNGREYLRSLKISGVKDCLDTKIQEMDNQIKIQASNDKCAKHLITIRGISYYAALLISSEIAHINRFPDYEHLSSYAKLVPGTHQSGETRYSKADRWLFNRDKSDDDWETPPFLKIKSKKPLRESPYIEKDLEVDANYRKLFGWRVLYWCSTFTKIWLCEYGQLE